MSASREDLDAAVRRAHRLCGAAILQAMAETDTSFAQIAETLGVGEGHVSEWLMQFAEGSMPSGSDGLRIVSHFMTSMGARIDVRFFAYAFDANVEARRIAKQEEQPA